MKPVWKRLKQGVNALIGGGEQVLLDALRPRPRPQRLVSDVEDGGTMTQSIEFFTVCPFGH